MGEGLDEGEVSIGVLVGCVPGFTQPHCPFPGFREQKSVHWSPQNPKQPHLSQFGPGHLHSSWAEVVVVLFSGEKKVGTKIRKAKMRRAANKTKDNLSILIGGFI